MKVCKVLIADDEPYVARVLKLVLQKEGYQVDCVVNGQLALDAYRKTRPDILITDVKMPHMSGHELVEIIRNTDGDKETPVVVMTSTLESENRDWVSSVSGVLFVGKPVSPRELVRIVNEQFACSKAS